MADETPRRTPEEQLDYIRETLQNTIGDMDLIIDTSTPAGCLAFARSIFPHYGDRITAAEIVDGELHIGLAAALEFITVDFTVLNKELTDD